jgi:hypothetical protein
MLSQERSFLKNEIAVNNYGIEKTVLALFVIHPSVFETVDDPERVHRPNLVIAPASVADAR